MSLFIKTVDNFFPTHPLAARKRAAGEFRAIDPAGEMWSVVTESPKLSNT